MKDVAVVSYCRTGIARAERGALNQTHGIPMTAHVLSHAVARAGIEPAEVEDVVVGCGLPEGATGHNIARNAALEAGFGDARPGHDHQPLLRLGAQRGLDRRQPDRGGRGERRVAGGVESISLVQFNLNLNGFFYEPLQQRMPAVWWTMNQTADFVAKKYGISARRRTSTSCAASSASPRRRRPGKYAEEIVPFTTTMKVTDKATQATRRAGGHARSRRGPAPRHDARGAREAEARLPGRHDDRGQRLAALRRRGGRRADGRRRSPRAAACPILGLFRGMQLAAVAARGDEHRDRARDPEA